MSYQFEILKQASVRAVRSLGTRIIGSNERFTRGQATFARLVATTDRQEQTQKARLIGIMRPYVRKFAADKKQMHQFQKELKVAALGAIALKKVKARTKTEIRAYNAFAKVQSEATQELGIGAQSKSRSFTLPRGVRGEIEKATVGVLNKHPECDFEYSTRVTRGRMHLSIARIA